MIGEELFALFLPDDLGFLTVGFLGSALGSDFVILIGFLTSSAGFVGSSSSKIENNFLAPAIRGALGFDSLFEPDAGAKIEGFLGCLLCMTEEDFLAFGLCFLGAPDFSDLGFASTGFLSEPEMLTLIGEPFSAGISIVVDS